MDIAQFLADNGDYVIVGLIGALVGTVIRGLLRNHQSKMMKLIALEELLIRHKGRLISLMDKHDIFVSRERISIIDESWLDRKYRHLWPLTMAYVLDEVVGNSYYADQPTAYDELLLLLEQHGGDRLNFAQQMERYSDRAARGMRVAILRYDRDVANTLLSQRIALELSIGAVSESVVMVETEQAKLPVV